MWVRTAAVQRKAANLHFLRLLFGARLYHRLSAEHCHQQKAEECNSLLSGPAHAQLCKLNHVRKSTRLSSLKRAESLGTRLVNWYNVVQCQLYHSSTIQVFM